MVCAGTSLWCPFRMADGRTSARSRSAGGAGVATAVGAPMPSSGLIVGVTTQRSELSGLPGEVLLAEAREVMSAGPVDAVLLENLCGEIDRRILRGDLMIGILPVEASDV